jgi:hypothetical protein
MLHNSARLFTILHRKALFGHRESGKACIVRGSAMETKTKLLDHMRDVMRLKHLSLRMEDA